jgi:hypothetical protein
MPTDASLTSNTAVDYLNTLYRPDDRLAIVAVRRHGPDLKVEQRVVTARAAVRPGYQRFLRHLNATGHDIFVSMNPIRPETRSREIRSPPIACGESRVSAESGEAPG